MEIDRVRVDTDAYAAMIGHAYRGLPDEACGLLIGPPGGLDVVRFAPCRNAAASAKLYAIADDELEEIASAAIADGFDVLGTMHSHTHTEPYPSPTDQKMALPWWTYVIVSLKQDAPQARAYRMPHEGEVVELPIDLVEIRPGSVR